MSAHLRGSAARYVRVARTAVAVLTRDMQWRPGAHR